MTCETPAQAPDALSVEAYYKEHRDSFDEPFRVRLHRSLSWLKKALAFKDDPDFMFIALWIAFNAVYGREIQQDGPDRPFELFGDRAGYKRFLTQLCEVDGGKRIYDALWVRFSGPVRLLISNRFTYQLFWDFQKGKLSHSEIVERYEQNRALISQAVAHMNTELILSLIFDRLYTVRNQLVHGGATYLSRVNRAQINDGCTILAALMPIFLQIIMENPKEDWGDLIYPLIREGQDL